MATLTSPGQQIPVGVVNTPPAVISAPTFVRPGKSYWETPTNCNPARQSYKCPIIIYIILIIIGIIINIWAIFRTPGRNRNEQPISTGQLWWAFFIGIIFYFVLALLFGWWIFQQCRACETESSGIIFILAIFAPVVIAVLTGVVMGSVLNVGFLWTAATEPNPN